MLMNNMQMRDVEQRTRVLIIKERLLLFGVNKDLKCFTGLMRMNQFQARTGLYLRVPNLNNGRRICI